ncbi:MAG: hypothetical protein JSU91_02355 [Thermoplasmatales archaeon]|nr:MAG: hypothetical protein JSU91_02355 [Thermoplasmatales archaeon]
MSLFNNIKSIKKKFNNLYITNNEPEKSILESSSKDELKFLQKELENKKEELEIRGKIIEDIHKQLQDNLIQLIEKTDFANNLEKEFIETKTLLKIKDEDITKLKEELEDRRKNPEYINTQLIRLNEELHQSKIEKLQKQQEINDLKIEFEKKEQELESLFIDMESRNNIIQNVTNQLMDKQMNLVEQHTNSDNIIKELENNLLNLNTKEDKISHLQKELIDTQNYLETMKTDLEQRNKIISGLKDQLFDNQHNFTENSLRFDELELDQKIKNENIQQLKKELQEKEKNIEYRNNLLSRQQDEITGLVLDLETVKQDTDYKKENILELRTELENKQHDLESMKTDIELRNKIINEIKNQMIENQDKFTEKNFLINELDDIKMKISENKSALEMVEKELANRKTELQSVLPTQQDGKEPWKENLSLNEEIDEIIDVANDPLKTKKLDFETEIDED